MPWGKETGGCQGRDAHVGGCVGCWYGLAKPGSPSWDLEEGQSWAGQQAGECGDGDQPWLAKHEWKERRGKWPSAPPPPPRSGAINTTCNEPLPMPGISQSRWDTRHSRAWHGNCQWGENLSSPCHAVGGPHGSSSCHRVLGRAGIVGWGGLKPRRVIMAPPDLPALCTHRKLWNMKLKDPKSR